MAKLAFISGNFAGRTYELAAQRTTVGRGDTNTLSIHDNSVSEQHCEIYDNGEDLIIRDLDSRNGTMVNGKLLRAAQGPLAHGEIVKFGAIEARLEIPPRPTSNDTATDVTAVHFHAHKTAAPQSPAPNPSAILDPGTKSPPADHTMMLLRPESPIPVPTTPPQAPAPRINFIWLYIVAAFGLAALLWWILRR